MGSINNRSNTLIPATSRRARTSSSSSVLSSVLFSSITKTTAMDSMIMNKNNVLVIESLSASSSSSLLQQQTNTNTKIETTATALSSKEFLATYPLTGAYTTARTSQYGTAIFEWNAHVQRTVASIRSMMEDSAVATSSSSSTALLSFLLDDDLFTVRHRLDTVVAKAVQHYKQINTNNNDDNSNSQKSQPELKITVLVGWKKKEKNNDQADDSSSSDSSTGVVDIACHVTELPSLPTRPVRVEIRGTPRDNAAAKDSSWVTERLPLEQLMLKSYQPMNELLLTTTDSSDTGTTTTGREVEETMIILEGSQTNFYAIHKDGTVYTAEDGILKGTVRTILLDICAREHIPVVLEPPNMKLTDIWVGALISSTSRLALPIDAIYLPKSNQPTTQNDLLVAFPNNNGNDDGNCDASKSSSSSLAQKIQHLVAKEVEARSIPIIALPVNDDSGSGDENFK